MSSRPIDWRFTIPPRHYGWAEGLVLLFLGGGGGGDLDGEGQGLLHRLAGLLLTEDEVRLGADRLLAGLGPRDRDVEAGALFAAGGQVGAREFGLLDRHAGRRGERDGDRRLVVDVPAPLHLDRQAGRSGGADGDLRFDLCDLVERFGGACGGGTGGNGGGEGEGEGDALHG